MKGFLNKKKKHGEFMFTLLALTFIVSCQPRKTEVFVENGILIENVTIISADALGSIVSQNSNVVIDQGYIKAISNSKPKLEGEYATVDGNGKFLIPGLIDSHVHLNNIAGINPSERNENPDLVTHYFERLPLNFLYYGYTSLVDVDNYAPEMINNLKSVAIGPDIYTCGAKVQIMNDFEMVMNETPKKERLQLPFLFDSYNSPKVPDSIDLKKHSPKFLVNKIYSEGNQCIKVLYEDASSGLPELWDKPSKQIIRDLVSEAHKRQLPVLLHAPSFEGQGFALDTEVDIIAHAMWNWTDDPNKFLNTDLPETHYKLLLEIAKRQVGYQPTFRVLLAEADILEQKFIDEQPLAKLYSKSFIEYLKHHSAVKAKNRILFRLSFLEKINPDFIRPIRKKFDSSQQLFDSLYSSYKTKMEKVVQVISKNGGNLLFGTDNGAMNMYTHPPGLNGFLEMKHWSDAGIPLEQIFLSATYNNATEFNLLDHKGTIEVGKEATLLLLNENPLKDIEAYDRIESVIIKGKVIQRETLSL